MAVRFAKNPLGYSAESLAKAFQRYEEYGAAHLIIQLTPFTLPALARVANAAGLYRDEYV